MKAYLLTYLEELNAEAEKRNCLHQLKMEAEAKAKLATSIQTIKRTKPLSEQISELMASLPPSIRDRPWSMAELTARLQGKYRDRPHPQQVGEALRMLRWRRVRLYGEGFCGVRVWVPSTYFSVDEASSVVRRDQSNPPQ